jgi:hypothetical protein
MDKKDNDEGATGTVLRLLVGILLVGLGLYVLCIL